MTFVADFQPQILWKHFDKILTIPRGSKNEQQMRDYIVQEAEKLNFPHQEDSAGNLVVRKPGISGKGSISVLQSHLDMVNEKNQEVAHDFSVDAIRPVRNKEYLLADGTTLGSDNGIGVAASLAVMESKDIAHGPLEFLFTVDEETGLTGASNLSTDFLQARRLINMDSEEEGALYVGCAGGAGVDISISTGQPTSTASAAMEIQLTGLRGGHSGVDIHLQRGNAIRLLARMLVALRRQFSIYLSEFSGGNMHNAIPREARTLFCFDPAEQDQLVSLLQEDLSNLQSEFMRVDPDLRADWKILPEAPSGLDQKHTDQVLYLLQALPSGVQNMSNDIPSLVETSANIATCRWSTEQVQIHVSNRSSSPSALQALQNTVLATAWLGGAEAKEVEGYPGWEPNMESELLKISRRVYQEIFGQEPEIKAIHAGLECGIIGEKYPSMDMISFGPQIEFPHSPDERVEIQSVDRFFRLLVGVLEALGAP